MMQKANRKSHLQAPLSPATQALLKSEGPFSGGSPSQGKDSKTPTSGEIPIVASASTHSFVPDPVHTDPVHRAMSADISSESSTNGYTHYPSDRPGFPPRTSSTSVLPSRTRESNERASFIPQSGMPIRPAPAPGIRPDSRGSMTNRRYPQHQGEGQMI